MGDAGAAGGSSPLPRSYPTRDEPAIADFEVFEVDVLRLIARRAAGGCIHGQGKVLRAATDWRNHSTYFGVVATADGTHAEGIGHAFEQAHAVIARDRIGENWTTRVVGDVNTGVEG